jgi:hypothetical protein
MTKMAVFLLVTQVKVAKLQLPDAVVSFVQACT